MGLKHCIRCCSSSAKTSIKQLSPHIGTTCSTGDTTRLNTPQGKLIGRQLEKLSGGKYYSFQGIPYAQPPIGNLRFRAPQYFNKWEDVLDTTKEKSVCCQEDRNNLLVGSEDCLFLNVYTPSTRIKRLLPVMVWIHGGGIDQGSGNRDLLGPDYLIGEDVVLVTINFRLGPLGYLCLETAEVPGNCGSKDQIAALKWVQENIKTYCGNPKLVTIFGMGAGAAMVHSLLLSPLAKGLFQRAIMHSGSIFNGSIFTQNPRARAKALSRLLGNETVDPRELGHFLRTVPAMDLVEASYELRTVREKIQSVPAFGLVAEQEYSRKEAFITEKPSSLVHSGRLAKVPIMLGYNEHEGIAYLKDAMDHIDEIERDFEIIVPLSMGVPPGSQKSNMICDKIRNFYFGVRGVRHAIPELIDLLSDIHVIRGIHATIRTHTKSLPAVYFYKFNFEGKLNLYKNLINGLKPVRGVSQGDELFYLFKPDSFNVDVDKTSTEYALRNRMVKLWTNFAKFGNPTASAHPDLPVKWLPTNTNKFSFMHLGQDMTMSELPLKERAAFWDDIQKHAYDKKKALAI